MKINLDPMPALRVKAAASVNARFAALVDPREVTWARKRALARAVKAGEWVGGALAEEATLRGLTVESLADLILFKPDPAAFADARELRRQSALMAIDAAQTPAELDAILAGLK